MVDNQDSKRKCMEGAGCKVISEDLERTIIQWIFTMRRRNLRVSHKMILQKATEVFGDVEYATTGCSKPVEVGCKTL